MEKCFFVKRRKWGKKQKWAVLRSAMLNLRCSNRLKKIFLKKFRTSLHLKKTGNVNNRNLNFLRNNTVVFGCAGFFLCIVNERKQRTILTKSPKTKYMTVKKQPVPRINSGFHHYSDGGLNVKAGAISDGMHGNTSFPNPTPTMEVFDAARDSYSKALELASSRGADAIANKNQLRVQLIALLIELANYVTLTANGDRAKLISSRFDLRKQGMPRPPIPKPQNIKVVDGPNPGMIVMSVDAVPGSRSYSHEYTADPLTPDSVWTVVSSTSRKCTISNLESGKKIWCRIAAVGIRGQFTYSDTVSRIVQ